MRVGGNSDQLSVEEAMPKQEPESDPGRADEAKSIADSLNSAMRSVQEMVVNYTAAVRETERMSKESSSAHLDVHTDADLLDGSSE